MEESGFQYISWGGLVDPCTRYTTGGKQYELRCIVTVSDPPMLRDVVFNPQEQTYERHLRSVDYVRMPNGGEEVIRKEHFWIYWHKKHGEYNLLKYMFHRQIGDSPQSFSMSKGIGRPYLAYVQLKTESVCSCW